MKQIKRWNYKCASFDYAQEPRINYMDWLAHDVFGHKSFINQSLIFASVLEDDGGKPPGLIAL